MPNMTLSNKNIHYETYGTGQPVLFVHGWGGSIKSLRKLAKLVSRTHKTYILDLPGFGKSDNPDPSWGVAEYAEIVAAFITEEKLKNLIFFGHSFGGSLGIYLTSHQMAPIKKLILCASSYKRTGKSSSTAVRINRIVETYLPFFSHTWKVIKPVLYRIFFPNSDYGRYPHLIPNFRKIITHDLTPYIKDITVPTLLLWGERDTYTPVALADELEATIKESKKVIFPFKRHNLPIRYPEVVFEEMKPFLASK
jgi:pimeloyl-ACP methyl ester carboxylesterase